MPHCSDNGRDRAIGVYWERQFCCLAARMGLMFTPLQIGRYDSTVAHWRDGVGWKQLTLPDVTIWTSPGQHHEIKHKNATKWGAFGLERYRFDALLRFAATTQQAVFYTIHDHDLAGGPGVCRNDIAHWITAEVSELDGTFAESTGPSWINGVKHDNVSMCYWSVDLWRPLLVALDQLRAVGAERRAVAVS